jgi:hypothetical protein
VHSYHEISLRELFHNLVLTTSNATFNW